MATLLEKGYTIQHVLHLLKKDKLIDKVIAEGSDVQAYLLKCCKGKFKEHLHFFILLSSLSEAIFSALDMLSFEQTIKHTFRQKMTYPCIVFVFSSLSIYMFSNFVIPQLLMQFENTTDFIYITILEIIKLISTSTLFGFVIVLFVALLISSNKTLKHLFYNHLAYRIAFFRNYISYYLSGYLRTLHQRGLSSKQAFQFLLNQNDSFLHKTVQSLNDELIKGQDLQICIDTNVYLSEKFKMFYTVGTHNANIETALEAYMENQRSNWFSKIKKVSVVAQCVAYLLVGALVICVYQIMLLPLSMI